MAWSHTLSTWQSKASPGLIPRMPTAFAWAIAIRSGNADRFPEDGPSKNWFTRFRKRHHN